MEKFNELVQGDIPVLADYFASWCGPRKMMAPILEEIKKLFADRIKIIKIDIDKPANRPLVMNHRVQSVPTLILYKKGEILWRQSGAIPTAQLREILEKHL